MSRKHKATTLGTSGSETYELSRAVASLLNFRAFLSEMGWPQLKPSNAKCDNKGSVATANAAVSDKNGLYLRRRQSFIQEAKDEGEISVEHVPGESNRADVLTKPLGSAAYGKARDVLQNVRRCAKNISAHCLAIGEQAIALFKA